MATSPRRTPQEEAYEQLQVPALSGRASGAFHSFSPPDGAPRAHTAPPLSPPCAGDRDFGGKSTVLHAFLKVASPPHPPVNGSARLAAHHPRTRRSPALPAGAPPAPPRRARREGSYTPAAPPPRPPPPQPPRLLRACTPGATPARAPRRPPAARRPRRRGPTRSARRGARRGAHGTRDLARS